MKTLSLVLAAVLLAGCSIDSQQAAAFQTMVSALAGDRANACASLVVSAPPYFSSKLSACRYNSGTPGGSGVDSNGDITMTESASPGATININVPPGSTVKP